MDELDRSRLRLQQARGPAATMTAACDVFDAVAAACLSGGCGSHELYAAFAFAAEAAVQGRAILTPAVPGPVAADLPAGSLLAGVPDLEVFADTVADLAGVLRDSLDTAARQASDLADREACGGAAVQAAIVRGLLVRGS